MSNTTIELKHSQVTGNTPASLANGEISINTADGLFFYKDPTGTIRSFGAFAGPSGLNGEIQFNDSGELGASANLSFDKTSGTLSVSKLAVPFIRKTANYTAVNGDKIIADTSAGTFTITLPATPSLGAMVTIADGANWGNNFVTIARNGSTIEGLSENLDLDIGTIKVEFIYDGTTWEVISPVVSASITTSDDTATDTSYYPSLITTVNGGTVKTSSTKLYFNPSSGTLSATSLNSLSDENLKENIKSLDKQVLQEINPVEFTWKDSGNKSYGIIAQDLEKILPELVETNEFSGLKSVSYSQLIPFLINEIKNLQKQIDVLKESVK
jgi:hypothetical protein